MTPVDQLSTTQIAFFIAFILLALIAAIVNGAYILFSRRNELASQSECQRMALRVWKERKEDLQERIEDRVEEQVIEEVYAKEIPKWKEQLTKKLEEQVEEDLEEFKQTLRNEVRQL